MSFFDAGQEDIEPDFEALPAGIYQLMVDECVAKQTKSGQGVYISTSLEVVSGDFTGRKVFCNFNIENPNEQAQKIGRSDFAKFLIALESPVLNTYEDCATLQNKMVMARVKIKANKQTGAKENRIGKFKAMEQQQRQQPMNNGGGNNGGFNQGQNPMQNQGGFPQNNNSSSNSKIPF